MCYDMLLIFYQFYQFYAANQTALWSLICSVELYGALCRANKQGEVQFRPIPQIEIHIKVVPVQFSWTRLIPQVTFPGPAQIIGPLFFDPPNPRGYPITWFINKSDPILKYLTESFIDFMAYKMHSKIQLYKMLQTGSLNWFIKIISYLFNQLIN